jgi:serine/threonine protein kinase
LIHSDFPLDQDQAYQIALGIAQGLDHLHKGGVVHRDVAARNVLLDENLVPKIADFGFARDLGKRDWGVTTEEFGPVKIMAPESILFRMYSPKSDVWSFGLILVELYSRKQIYDKVPFSDVMKQVCHLKQTYPIPEEAPPLMQKLMQLCWKYEPTQRPDMNTICHLLQIMNMS